MAGKVDLNFYFMDYYILFDGERFEYTTPLGKKYSSNRAMLSQKAIDSIVKDDLNVFEKHIFDWVLDEDRIRFINHKDEFIDDNYLSYLLDFYDDEEDWLNYINGVICDFYYDLDQGESDEWRKLLDFLVRYLDFRINYAKKIDSVVESYGVSDPKYNDFIWETILDEFGDPFFDCISEDSISFAIRDVTWSVYNSLLSKEDYEKMMRLERKSIKEAILLSDKMSDLMGTGILTKPKVPEKENSLKIDKEKKCYIMKDSVNNLYKIGNSVNPKVRERTLQSEKPSISIVKIFKQNHEAELHKRYNEFRKRGEWFELTNVQLKYICTHYE